MDASEATNTFQVKIIQTSNSDISDSHIYRWTQVLIKPNSPDLKIIESEKQIGIDSSRELKSFFTTTPIHLSHKIVLIKKAETLTYPAQQALLKILEEPPEFGFILLTTNNPYKLLPTIRSRCQIVLEEQTSELANKSSIQIPQKFADRLLESAKYATKEKSLTHLQELISHFRFQMLNNPNPQIVFNLTLTLFVQKMLNQNVSPSLAMDYLYLLLK